MSTCHPVVGICDRFKKNQESVVSMNNGRDEVPFPV